MGKLPFGINGPIQGKIGTVHGSSWKGIPYVKGPYKKRTKKVSKDEAANRNKFADAQAWLQPLKLFVRQGFKGYTDTVEGFIAAKSYLLLNAFEGVQPDIRINPALARLSYGDLPLSNDITVEKTPEGKLLFTWDPAYINGASTRDQVMLLAYDIENAKACFSITGEFRSTGADTLNLPAMAGRTYHLYFAFTAADRSRQSHSVYLGEMSY